MDDQIKLSPCPFCEGPPVPIVRRALGGGYFAADADYGDDGIYAEAFVFCHECGCDGPYPRDRTIYDAAEYLELEAEAVALWQQRDNRHRSMYHGGETEGLNLYPRNPESPQ